MKFLNFFVFLCIFGCYSQPVQQDDSSLILLSISGGGTRAGTMGWRTLEYLRTIPYVYSEKGVSITSNLADQIDVISGISGGSFAAAGWCFYRDSMQIFRKKFIENNIQLKLVGKLFIPWVGLNVLLNPFYSRIDVAAEYYDQYIFEKRTFKNLPSFPTLWINSTSLSLGDRFVFTREQFEMIGSDVGNYPVGYACAASSAFPILLDPITIRNSGQSISDSTLSENLKYRMAKKNSIRDPEKWIYCKKIEFYNDKRNKWIHLADGGLVDNQGLKAILDQFRTNGLINKRLNDSENPLKRLVIINVNAYTEKKDEGCQSRRPPNILSVMNYTMTLSMDILSFERWVDIRAACSELWKAKLNGAGNILEKPYCIEIAFRNVSDESVRNSCNDLPTSFHLGKNEIALIDSVIPQLIVEQEDFQKLKTSIVR